MLQFNIVIKSFRKMKFSILKLEFLMRTDMSIGTNGGVAVDLCSGIAVPPSKWTAIFNFFRFVSSLLLTFLMAQLFE